MQARDASGRKVSLLNDDSSNTTAAPTRAALSRPVSFQSASHVISQSYDVSRSGSSSPNTPGLLRSDSYDSQMSNNDVISPMTPNVDYAFPRQSMYSINPEFGADVKHHPKRPAYADSSRSSSYDDDNNSSTSPNPERPGKRYPCRYRDSHGCEKTFTTSGHASRHSKIHTAEKAVQCTFPGCQKKFTRADNMKQHLETHYKDKSRSSGAQRTQRASLAGSRRHSHAGRSRSTPRETWETEQYPLPTPPIPSPNGANGAWDMRGLNLPLLNRPGPATSPSSGLDALAMAVACQEGGRA